MVDLRHTALLIALTLPMVFSCGGPDTVPIETTENEASAGEVPEPAAETESISDEPEQLAAVDAVSPESAPDTDTPEEDSRDTEAADTEPIPAPEAEEVDSSPVEVTTEPAITVPVSGPGDTDIDPEALARFLDGFVRPWTPAEPEPVPQPDPKPEPQEELVADIPKKPEPEEDVEETEAPEVPKVTPPPPPPEKPEVPVVSGNLAISEPWEGAYYRALTDFSGTAPGFASLEWSSAALGSGGQVPIAEDGSWVFSISTHGHTDPVDVLVSGVDAAGEVQQLTVNLVNDGVGPSVKLDSPMADSFYIDELQVAGQVGAGPFDPPGIGEVESLTWNLDGEEPRPVFFGADGRFDFRIPTGSETGIIRITMTAADLNGNLSTLTVPLRDGRMAPEIVLSGPNDSDEYGAGITLKGRIIDPYSASPDFGGFESVTWEMIGTTSATRDGLLTGDLDVDADGNFSIPVLTRDLEGDQEVSIIALGQNGRRTIRRLTLKRGRSDIPDFSARSSDREAVLEWSELPLATDYEVTVTGSDGVTVRRNVSGIPARIPGLTNGREYTFRLEAMQEGRKIVSHEETTIPLTADTLAPEVTGEFQRIRIRWTPVPDSPEYAVFRADSPEGPFLPVSGTVSGREYLDTEVDFGARYWYSVTPAAYTHLLSRPVQGESRSEQESNVEELGRLDALVSDSVTVEGEYAFVASRQSGLVIVDITEPARPVSVGQVEIEGAEDVAVRGDYAYVAASTGGVKVVNITDPGYPLPVGSKLAGDACSIAVSGDYAYLADRDRGLRVVDVSDPRQPVRVHATDGLTGESLVMAESHIFLAANGDGVVVFNLSRPDSPKEVARIPLPGAGVLHSRGNYLMAGGPTCGLAIYDISAPASPRLLSRMDNLQVAEIETSEEFVLVTVPGQLLLVDIRDAQDPYVFQSYPRTDTTAMAVRDDSLLLAAADGLGIYQTFLVGSSYVTGTAATEGRSYAINGSGDNLLVSSHSGGVTVLDRNLNPEYRISSDFAEAAAMDDGGRIWIADGNAGLRVSDASGTDSAVIENIGRVRDVATHGSVCYAAADDGLLAADAGAGTPEVKEVIPFPGCRAVTVDEKVLHAAGKDGIRSYALLDGGTPAEVARISFEGVRYLDADNGLLIACSVDSVRLYDTTNPSRPEITVDLDIEGVNSAALDGNYIYLSSGHRGLEIYDIRNPASPKMVSSCEEVFAMDAVIDGSIAWVVDGMEIRKVSIFIPDWLK